MFPNEFNVHVTPGQIYIIAQRSETYQILKITRNTAEIHQDEVEYSASQIKQFIDMISMHAEVIHAVGIVGMVRLLNQHFLIFVTKRIAVAVICGHVIYKIVETTLVPLEKSISDEDQRYADLFQQIDFRRNFYFSYSYDLSSSLQRQNGQVQTQFVWNHALTLPFLTVSGKWHINLIHGFILQKRIGIFSHGIYVTLIARRSRHFAGPRFFKRGIDNRGFVANEVESEQIVHEWNSASSFVQLRGSIPLNWSQDSTISTKPPISLDGIDPFYSNTAKHFNMLLSRYGNVICLNLVKLKDNREAIPAREYENAVEYLNQRLEEKIEYIAWDMAKSAKKETVIPRLEGIATACFTKTGMYISPTELQTGIVRTNCIDCLDRTNAAQFILGKRAFSEQVFRLGLIEDVGLDFECSAMVCLASMWQEHGDMLALSYGGSGVVNSLDYYRAGSSLWRPRDTLETIKRFYNNSFTDAEKQAVTNLFLCVYKPYELHDTVPLWNLESDTVLHNPRCSWLDTPIPSYLNWYTPVPLKPVVSQSFYFDYYKPNYTHLQHLLVYQLIIANFNKKQTIASPFAISKTEMTLVDDDEWEESILVEPEETHVEPNVNLYTRWISLAAIHQHQTKLSNPVAQTAPLTSVHVYTAFVTLKTSSTQTSLFKQYLE
jgi:hypothetical protein